MSRVAEVKSQSFQLDKLRRNGAAPIRNALGGGHIDLAGGKPVLAAGEVKIVNGEIKYIDNTSGHYVPQGPSAQKAAEDAFAKAGLDAAGKYVEKVWDGKRWAVK